jgi:hypothetical protein
MPRYREAFRVTRTALRTPTGTLPELLVVAVLAVAASACGSPAGTAGPSASVLASTCEHVDAVLSDGPDPAADPVGYAEAQISPLRQITTSDASLRRAIARLASAYQTFYENNGAGKARAEVESATKEVGATCPGVAQ